MENSIFKPSSENTQISNRMSINSNEENNKPVFNYIHDKANDQDIESMHYSKEHIVISKEIINDLRFSLYSNHLSLNALYNHLYSIIYKIIIYLSSIICILYIY